VQGGQRRGEWAKPELNWKDLLTQETGFSYERCRDFMKTAGAIRELLLASRKKGDATLRQIVQQPPATWTALDYCTFADAIGEHFDAETFSELMADLGLVKPPKQIEPPADDDDTKDPYCDLRAAQDCVVTPIASLHRTMVSPEAFTRHLYALPLADQEPDRAAGIPACTGLMTLSHTLAQAQEQIAKAIADKRKGEKPTTKG